MSIIAILSDSHDHMNNMQAAINYANTKADILIHCGDLISPFMLKRLATFQGDVHLIYGNNTGDQHIISTKCATNFPSITHHGIFGEISHNGLSIAFVHYPEFARPLAETEKYDLVCCGHNHLFKVEHFGKTTLINPGELLGEDHDTVAGFVLFDCQSRQAEHLLIDTGIVDELPPVERSNIFI